MTMLPPLWFIDFSTFQVSHHLPNGMDEVDPDDAGRVRFVEYQEDSYDLRIADFVNKISRAGLADARWLSECADARVIWLSSKIGLDYFSSTMLEHWSDTPYVQQKADHVHELLQHFDRPIVWSDAEINDRSCSRFTDKATVRLFAVDRNYGLSQDQQAKIETFLTGLRLIELAPQLGGQSLEDEFTPTAEQVHGYLRVTGWRGGLDDPSLPPRLAKVRTADIHMAADLNYI